MTFSERDATMDALTRALPYLHHYRGRIFVLKAGGALCGDGRALRGLAEQVGVLRALGVKVVLVHGGGPQTSALSERLGLTTTLVDGRRVTCAETLEVAVMTLCGTVNTALLAAFRAAGVPAVGLSGLDAGLVEAVRRPVQVREEDGVRQTLDYGLVGDVLSVRPAVLETLLGADLVPVVCPLSADDSGQVLNINADTIASQIASRLGAEKLIFLSDTAGLLEDRGDPGSLVSYTDLAGLDALERRGAFDAGMLPKVKAAREALASGVRRVHMVGWRTRGSVLTEVFTNEGAGTLIVRDQGELAPSEAAVIGAGISPKEASVS